MRQDPYREAAPPNPTPQGGVTRGFFGRLMHRIYGCPDCKIARPCTYTLELRWETRDGP